MTFMWHHNDIVDFEYFYGWAGDIIQMDEEISRDSDVHAH